MKTYETEKKELFDWLCKENEKYNASVKKMILTGSLCRDSEADLAYQQKIAEYNRKLIELKRKYNVN